MDCITDKQDGEKSMQSSRRFPKKGKSRRFQMIVEKDVNNYLFQKNNEGNFPESEHQQKQCRNRKNLSCLYPSSPNRNNQRKQYLANCQTAEPGPAYSGPANSTKQMILFTNIFAIIYIIISKNSLIEDEEILTLPGFSVIFLLCFLCSCKSESGKGKFNLLRKLASANLSINYIFIYQSMYLEKQEIKQNSFLPQENKIRFLFDNKRIEQFIEEVQIIHSKKLPLSVFAYNAAQHFKQILRKNQRAMEILSSSKNGWKINKIDNKSELAVKVTGTNVELRYEGILSMNIQNLCIMIYQVNLFNHWVPFCTKGEDLCQVSPLEKTCFLQFKLPFLAERYAYFYGLGMDRIDRNGTIVIYGEGITENQEYLKKFGIKPDLKKLNQMVILDLKFFICEISYLSENEFNFKCYTSLDSRMPILPEWLVNAVIKQMGGFIFDRVIKQSQKFKGSVWQKQMLSESKNPFYSWLHSRIQAWHEKKKKESQKSKI